MIGLDQIKLLESKVVKAVEQIRILKEENKALKRTVEKSQARLQELEGMISRFRSDQDEIEQGILRALKNLDKLEDEVGARGGRKESAAHAPAASPAPAAPAAPAPQQSPPAAPARGAQSQKGQPAHSPAHQPAHESAADAVAEPVVDDAEDDEPDGAREEQLDIF